MMPLWYKSAFSYLSSRRGGPAVANGECGMLTSSSALYAKLTESGKIRCRGVFVNITTMCVAPRRIPRWRYPKNGGLEWRKPKVPFVNYVLGRKCSLV